MELEKYSFLGAAAGTIPRIILLCCVLLLSCCAPSAIAQTPNSRKPALIRDTDEESAESADAAKAKEPNPKLAKQSITIGNFYFKRGNYEGAIRRYLEALELDPGSIQALEALARAYEKNGDIPKAISSYKSLLEKNPSSPKSADFRDRLARLEKKSN